MKSVVAPALTLALLASLSAGAAQAASPIDADVRCLAITDRLAQSADAKVKQTGQMGQVFFLGRLNGAPGGPPTANTLAAAMVDAARTLKGDFAKTETTRCSGVMNRAVALLEAAGPIANKSLQANKTGAPR